MEATLQALIRLRAAIDAFSGRAVDAMAAIDEVLPPLQRSSPADAAKLRAVGERIASEGNAHDGLRHDLTALLERLEQKTDATRWDPEKA